MTTAPFPHQVQVLNNIFSKERQLGAPIFSAVANAKSDILCLHLPIQFDFLKNMVLNCGPQPQLWLQYCSYGALYNRFAAAIATVLSTFFRNFS